MRSRAVKSDQPTEHRRPIYAPLLVALLSLNYGIVFFDRNALSFLMPFIQPDLNLSATQIGLVASALSLTWSLAAYLLGHASDRTGRRKKLLVAATITFSLCSLLTGLAGSFIALLAVRLLMGAAEGGVLPVSLSMINAAVSERHRGLAIGVTQNLGSSVLGTFIAPIVLIAMAQAFGWRSAFYLAAIPGFAAALLIWLFVHEQPRRPVGEPMPPPRLRIILRERNVALCALVAIMTVSFFLISMSFMPLFLVQTRGFSPGDMSWLIAAMGVSSTLLSVLFSALADHVGRKPLMLLGSALGLLIPYGALFYHGGVGGLTMLFFLGWSPVALFPLFMGTIPAESVDPRHSATVIGLTMALGESIGGVLSPSLAGLLGDIFGLQATMWVVAGLSCTATCLSLFLSETAPRVRARRQQTFI